MRRIMFATIVVSTFIAGPAMAQTTDKETKVAIRDVPAAVQQAIKEYTQGSTTLRALTKETEDGKTVYEAELRVDGYAKGHSKGHSKDVTFDGQGKVVSL